MEIHIPGNRDHTIHHILLDFNGTLAIDGKLIAGVGEKINHHSKDLRFHVITADTFGSVETELQGIECRLVTIGPDNQARAKQDYLNTLGPDQTIACGNGANDRLMLEGAAIGISVLQAEGMASKTFAASDILIYDILDLFGYIETPGRLIACLRQ